MRKKLEDWLCFHVFIILFSDRCSACFKHIVVLRSHGIVVCFRNIPELLVHHGQRSVIISVEHKTVFLT